MPLPPILEVFVLWHPDDDLGEWVATTLVDHFHGPTFAGLAGGAVEVYIRSEGWSEPASCPRPMPFHEALPHGLAPAQMTVVVPVIGTGLARAAQDDPSWHSYLQKTALAEREGRVAVFGLSDPAGNPGGLRLILGRPKELPRGCAEDATTLCREVVQAIVQHFSLPAGDARLTVFVSHTTHRSLEEDDEDGPRLLEEVRRACLETTLATFVDSVDIPSGADWEETLKREATRNALLMIRTDLYAEREWTQTEVLLAKQHDVPTVALYALRAGQDRGSFLMDHVPAFPCRLEDPRPSIEKALNRLVDERLKRALWREQSIYLEGNGFDWLPAHAPEPVTVAPWLRAHQFRPPGDRSLRIMHPDPPLGPREREVIVEMCGLAGYTSRVDVLTPRTFAARGGTLDP